MNQRGTWEALALGPSWREYVLPGRTDEQFWREGREQVEQLASIVALPPTATVVDYGCGVGRLSIVLAERCGRVIGLDISRGLLGRISHHRDNLNYSHVDDFEERSCADVVISLMCLQHNDARDRGLILDRVIGLLRDDGVFVANFPRAGRGVYRGTSGDDGFMMQCFDREQVEAYGGRFRTHAIVEGDLAAYGGQEIRGGNEWWLVARK